MGDFKYSTLTKKQEQLGLAQHKLIQSRWDSVYFMYQRINEQKTPIVTILSDRSITLTATAIKLEIKEAEWSSVKNLVEVLKPMHLDRN